jgi:hypothetical protein
MKDRNEFASTRLQLLELHALWDGKIAAVLPVFERAKAEYERLQEEIRSYQTVKVGLKAAIKRCEEGAGPPRQEDVGLVPVVDPEDF